MPSSSRGADDDLCSQNHAVGTIHESPAVRTPNKIGPTPLKKGALQVMRDSWQVIRYIASI